MQRRQFIKASIAGLAATAGGLLPRMARGIGLQQRVRLMEVRYDGNWSVRSGAASYLADEVRFRTSVDIATEPLVLRPTDDRFSSQAMAIVAGDGDLALSADEGAVLKQWIELGGLLFIDNSGMEEPSARFDASVRRELGALFPGHALERVSPEHVLFRSFFRLDYPAGRAIHKPYVEGLKLGPRYAVIYCQNDLLGAYARSARGPFTYTPRPGGEHQREMALRFGINIVMYALCLHYKDDQVHLDYLLHRRKWRIRKPE